jgi:chromate transporter
VTGTPGGAEPPAQEPAAERVPLAVIARQWLRLGLIGFGGPPAHIALLRKLVVQDRKWLPEQEFEDGVAAVNLLPGPASTQLTIYCAWRLRGAAGALLGGACFILPGLVIILALAALFLAEHPPGWIAGAALGAGSAVPAVAVAAAVSLVPASWRRAGVASSQRGRWIGYLIAGGAAAALVGPWLVLVLIGCGLIETAVRARPAAGQGGTIPPLALAARLATTGAVAGGLASLAWVAFKVGALSFGGGFVIIPLMQHDAVNTYHWMTAGQFLTAVALGQVTPGPVVQTIAVIGYAAAGVGGGLLASLVAFTPSFCFVLAGGRYFDRLRRSAAVQSFLTGAGPAAIGAIAGAAIPLAAALAHLWQVAVLAVAAGWLIGLRRSVVTAIVGAAALGVLTYLAGGPV